MSNISEAATLSERYMNHCIRATTVTRLCDSGIDPQDIVAVTGHRCVASISSYSSTNAEKRRQMSHKFSSAIGKEVRSQVLQKKNVCMTPGYMPKTQVQVVKPTPHRSQHKDKVTHSVCSLQELQPDMRNMLTQM